MCQYPSENSPTILHRQKGLNSTSPKENVFDRIIQLPTRILPSGMSLMNRRMEESLYARQAYSKF